MNHETNSIETLTSRLARHTSWLNNIAAVALIILVLAIVVDVVSRNFGFVLIVGTNELAGILMTVMIVLALPQLQVAKKFLNVDVFLTRQRPRVYSTISIAIALLSFSFSATLAYYVLLHAINLWSVGQITDVMGIPQFIPFAVAFVALALVALATLLQVLESIQNFSNPKIIEEVSMTEVDAGDNA